MRSLFRRLTVTTASLLFVASYCCAGPLDDYYLQSFGEPSLGTLQKTVLLQQQEIIDLPHCGTPLKHGLQRDWGQLEPATQKTLAKQLAAPVLNGTESTLVSPSGRFLIHYTTSGADAVPSVAWAQTVAQTFDDVAVSYIGLGWSLAPTTAAAPYDVYLRELSDQRLYGQTTFIQSKPSPGFANAVTSFIEIDNNYLEAVYQNALGAGLTSGQKALQSLQITAAHEYHHAIQYGYNLFFDVWYAEATSTWFEDELYDNVNQLYNYLFASMNNTFLSLDIATSVTTGGGYGRWLFNRHLAEAQGGQPLIRSFWERLATTTPPTGGGDIPMSPILDAILLTKSSSIGNELFAYASKLYTGAWTTKTAEIQLIHPAVMISEFDSNLNNTINAASVPSPSITLPHYSIAFFKLLPPTAVSSTLTITLTRDTGISAVAFRKLNTTIDTFVPASGNNQIVIPGFSSADEVVILFVNTTVTDNLFAGFSTDRSTILYALSGTEISVAATAVSPASISLSWPAVPGATSYRIFRSSTSSTSLTAYDTTSGTTFTDTSVAADHTYFYSVIPVQSAGLAGPATRVKSVTLTTTTTPVSNGGGGGGGGCFIATAAYGSYLHPQVQILRDFRDTWLLTNAPGRAFVALYYRLSPPVAGFIAQHETLRLLARLLLTPVIFMISNLMLTFLVTGTAILALKIRSIRRDMIHSLVPK